MDKSVQGSGELHQNDSWHFRSIENRLAIQSTITSAEKIMLLQGMILTRATDNALKKLFLSGEIKYRDKGFQGKGFRSLGQEAIFGATLKLNHGSDFFHEGIYTGDVTAPLIRDLGVFLAMTNNDVASVINAQAGKVGGPSNGRDLHIGDFSKGVLMPAAPLAIATCTLIGIALSFKIKKEPRVAISFVGEGASSLGAWHEAINFAAVQHLPMVFCIQNNQTALSTPVAKQSRVKNFVDKAIGYGLRGLAVDGNDIEAVACAFKFAADEARAGQGPVMIELVTMRMCGHAHHDDMLYLGKDPNLSFTIDPPRQGGYVDEELYQKWRARDPLRRYEEKLVAEHVVMEHSIEIMKAEAEARVTSAVSEIIARPWPKFTESDQQLVFKAPWIFVKSERKLDHAYQFSPDGVTYLQAIADGIQHVLQKYPLSVMIGEDVALPYGNAFMMFRAVNEKLSDRFIDTPIAENAIVGACVGMAMSGMRPIGEIQFNDFIACAMDQVVNNAAKLFFRTGLNAPMVLRMPYGGLRRAGPYHSQDTSPWFFQTPGLKIMAPSTPQDAFNMIIAAVDDPDPVLYFEHIALYREPKIKQLVKPSLNFHFGAALAREGEDITLVSYGAYVHLAMKAAQKLAAEHQISADVIDLRYLAPIDFDAIHDSLRKTSRVLLLGEDKKTGGIMQMIAGRIAQECFFQLDAPVTVLGSRDTPVPYAPSLEDDYLLSEDAVVAEAIKLCEY